MEGAANVSRRKIHSNRHKRIRRAIESALIATGMPFADCYDRVLNCHMVSSRKSTVYIQRELSHDFPSLEDWGRPVQVFEGAALLWAMDPSSPRAIYQRTKQRVQTARKQGRARILQELRDRITGRAAAALELARAEAIQREYETVSRLQGMGLPDSEEGEGSDQREHRLSDVSRAGEDRP